MKSRSQHKNLRAPSKYQRRVRQEDLILEVTEVLTFALNETGTTRAELAKRLNRSKSFVSQLFGGGRNLTLRTMADVAGAIGCEIRINVVPARDELIEVCTTVIPFAQTSWNRKEDGEVLASADKPSGVEAA